MQAQRAVAGLPERLGIALAALAQDAPHDHPGRHARRDSAARTSGRHDQLGCHWIRLQWQIRSWRRTSTPLRNARRSIDLAAPAKLVVVDAAEPVLVEVRAVRLRFGLGVIGLRLPRSRGVIKRLGSVVRPMRLTGRCTSGTCMEEPCWGRGQLRADGDADRNAAQHVGHFRNRGHAGSRNCRNPQPDHALRRPAFRILRPGESQVWSALEPTPVAGPDILKSPSRDHASLQSVQNSWARFSGIASLATFQG